MYYLPRRRAATSCRRRFSSRRASLMAFLSSWSRWRAARSESGLPVVRTGAAGSRRRRRSRSEPIDSTSGLAGMFDRPLANAAPVSLAAIEVRTVLLAERSSTSCVQHERHLVTRWPCVIRDTPEQQMGLFLPHASQNATSVDSDIVEPQRPIVPAAPGNLHEPSSRLLFDRLYDTVDLAHRGISPF